MTDQIIQQILTHISILNAEIGTINTTLATLTERVDWLCKFFWLIVGIVSTLLITQFWQVWFMRKNNKSK